MKHKPEGRPESEFPTIRDLRDGLTRLIDGGFGDLPVQIVIVPSSTMEALARDTQGPDYDPAKPALLVELDTPSPARMSVTMLSAEYLKDGKPGMQ
jgi:hypothetical protein